MPGIDGAKAQVVLVSVLWCGQGMANVLETYSEIEWAKPENERVPSSLVLLDFGTEPARGMVSYGKSRHRRAKTATEYVKKVIARTKDQMIDLVIASHADMDHWALLSPLIIDLKENASFGKGKDKKFIKRFIKGGLSKQWRPEDKPYFISELNYVEKHTEKVEKISKLIGKEVNLEKGYSNYRSGPDQDLKKIPFLLEIDGIQFRSLIANLPSSVDPVNTASLVVTVDFEGQRVVQTGDATWRTLNEANSILSQWAKSPIMPVIMMTVPHHGSRGTSVEIQLLPQTKDKEAETDESSKKRRKKEQQKFHNFGHLEKFVDLTKPGAVVASAYYGQNGYHPHGSVLARMRKYTYHDQLQVNGLLKDEIGPHPIVFTHQMSVNDQWQQYQIGKNPGENTFTTRLTVAKTTKVTVAGSEVQCNVADYLYVMQKNGTTQRWRPSLAEPFAALKTCTPVDSPWAAATEAKDEEMTPLVKTEEEPKDTAMVLDLLPKPPADVFATSPGNPVLYERDRQSVLHCCPDREGHSQQALNPIGALLRRAVGHPSRAALPVRRVRPLHCNLAFSTEV